MPFKINLCKNSEFYFRNSYEFKCLEVSFHDNLRIVFQNQLVIVIYISEKCSHLNGKEVQWVIINTDHKYMHL